ncbi:hypothetical protein B0T22DRAFT_445042 [Podospora appendiculata]|uniref:Capsule polysaccharide biosynthesis protein n=1 Tax=Podospora appendiculata TaxID=314037 RepID=A0AAE1C8L3_9PEZI|nr:hypothetical protein B0T22DRAFT_445042 [Podospora appendiculata]
MSAPTAPDHRSDDEILASLQQYTPVDPTSEKNVWAFWDKGLAKCPAWNQRNIISWVRRLGPSWTVRVLDMVEGSPVHFSRFIPASLTPATLIRGTMAGPHAAPAASDLIRLPLVYLYGGVWMDVGFFLFRSLDSLCWNALADPTTPYEMATFAVNMGPTVGMIYNGLLAARKGNRCFELWHQIYLEVWKGATSTKGFSQHRLLRHLPKYEPPTTAGRMPPFQYAAFVDYMGQVFALERLRHLRDPSRDWDGLDYFANRVLMYDCSTEVYWAQRLTGWDGRKQFELLSRQRDGGDVESEAYKEAEAFVQGILDTSATMKISHGLAVPGREYLASLWDLPENRDKDREPGTFAAHLRWASEHLEQTRPLKPVLLPVMEKAILVGGVLEAEGVPRED